MVRLHFGKALAIASTVLLVLAACAPAAPAAKFPSKPIIFVASGTVGGGADVQARLAAAAIDAGKLLTEPVAVLNKGAGGTQEAFTFMKGKKGDAHYALTTSVSFITGPIRGAAAYDPKTDFTPIANLVFDPPIIVVPADSKFKTLKDLIDAAKAKPDSISIGGGSIGSQDHFPIMMLQETAGITLKYIPFSGGAEIHRNVLGGQVEVATGNPSDFLSSLQAKKLRPLAILDEKRNPAPDLKDIPTGKELGYDVSFVVWRGWFGPAGISPTEVQTLEGLFAKVMENKDFQDKYIIPNGMRPNYLPSAEFAKFLDAQAEVYRKLMTKAGIIK